MGFNLKVLSLLAALIGTWLVPVHAQTAASSQPIRIIVPYAAGGLVDVMNRILASRMAQTLGQPVIVENKPGANANIGAAFVAQAEPDGLTLLATASYFSANPLIEANLQWAPKKLVPIARLCGIAQFVCGAFLVACQVAIRISGSCQGECCRLARAGCRPWRTSRINGPVHIAGQGTCAVLFHPVQGRHTVRARPDHWHVERRRHPVQRGLGAD